MKISDIEKKIDATYNTIIRFIESDPGYHKKVDNVLHATDLGMDKLEEQQKKSSIESEVCSNFARELKLFI